MIKLYLSQDKIAIIDDIDSDLANLKWSVTFQPTYADDRGYRVHRKTSRKLGKQKTQYLSRVIMERVLGKSLSSSEIVDHYNRNPLDNRRENLRLANKSNNGCNRTKQANNSSGFKGVSWISEKEKYKSSITVNGKTVFLGYYDDPIKAAEAYDVEAVELHGKFALLNF